LTEAGGTGEAKLNPDETRISRDHVNDLVDRKIAEAELIVERRWNRQLVIYGGLLITIVGILLPLYQFRELKADFEKRFQELSNREAARPDLSCIVDGAPLTGQSLTFDNSVAVKDIGVDNKGTGAAKEVLFQMYLDQQLTSLDFESGESAWWEQVASNESGFTTMFWLGSTSQQRTIRPGERFLIHLEMPKGLNRGTHRMMLKVLCENHEATSFRFTIFDQRSP
jgi:hypothetical protein